MCCCDCQFIAYLSVERKSNFQPYIPQHLNTRTYAAENLSLFTWTIFSNLATPTSLDIQIGLGRPSQTAPGLLCTARGAGIGALPVSQSGIVNWTCWTIPNQIATTVTGPVQSCFVFNLDLCGIEES